MSMLYLWIFIFNEIVFWDYIRLNCVIKKYKNAIENMTIMAYNIKRKRGTQKGEQR